MTLRAFAERILFGATLDDKLTPIADRDDRDPGPPIEPPQRPARPPSLAFPAERGTFDFPTLKQLEQDAMRGKALHFFANHELLALELMALMLLRFPGAPHAFRAGLVRTMLDEQKHLSLYRARMNALGVELGDVEVNDYFWRAMKDARSPIDFVVSMSLTFEQANLDFTQHYASLIRTIGDRETADVLDAVYADEIRHVRHGARWLEEWRERGEDDWDAYRRLLPAPLSPARAKGPIFDAEGRRQAGLSERFIRELSIFAHSKGRTPKVWAFEAGCEEAIAAGPKYTPQKPVLDIEHDLAPLMMFLAAKDDLVLVAERPSTAHLELLASAGFAIPELTTAIEGPISGWIGWGSSPRSRDLAERHGAALDPIPDAVFSKLFALELRTEVAKLPEVAPLIVPDVSAVAHSVEEALAAAEAIFERGHARAVAKAPFSSSGRHRILLRPSYRSSALGLPSSSLERGPLAANTERWLEGRTVLVEPWLDRVRDLSLLIDVGPTATERLSFDCFLTDARGRYRGHLLGPPLFGLELEPLFRKADLFAALDPIAKLVGDRLRERGHRGPAGIDMLLHRKDGELWWQPVVEVNPRLTMGFVARALRKRLAPGSYGVWKHAPIAEVRAVKPELEMDDRGIVRGVIPTNDLSQARAVGTILYVEPDARCLST